MRCAPLLAALVVGAAGACVDPCDGPEAIHGDVAVRSQSDVAQLAGATCVDGDLEIGGSSDAAEDPDDPVVDLAAARDLVVVERALRIKATSSLTSVAGLEQLTFVGRTLYPTLEHTRGDLTVADNVVLASIAGLTSVEKVGGCIAVVRNPRLTDAAARSELAGMRVLAGDIFCTEQGTSIDISGNGGAL